MSRLDLAEFNIKSLERETQRLQAKLASLEVRLIKARLIQSDICPMFPSRVVDVEKLQRMVVALTDHFGIKFVHIDKDKIVKVE